MEGPAGTSITYVQNLCSDFIAAEGGQIVIPQHFSCQQSNLMLCQILFFCFFRLMISCYISFLFIVISESVISDSVIAISFFWLYQIPLLQILLYQFPFLGYIRFRYIRFRYIKFLFLVISVSVISESVISISLFCYIRFRYINFLKKCYIRFRYIKFRYINFPIPVNSCMLESKERRLCVSVSSSHPNGAVL